MSCGYVPGYHGARIIHESDMYVKLPRLVRILDPSTKTRCMSTVHGPTQEWSLQENLVVVRVSALRMATE
jgi:hypothetical protein